MTDRNHEPGRWYFEVSDDQENGPVTIEEVGNMARRIVVEGIPKPQAAKIVAMHNAHLDHITAARKAIGTAADVLDDARRKEYQRLDRPE